MITFKELREKYDPKTKKTPERRGDKSAGEKSVVKQGTSELPNDPQKPQPLTEK